MLERGERPDLRGETGRKAGGTLDHRGEGASEKTIETRKKE